MSETFIRILVSVLAAAFLAWAGVVWEASQTFHKYMIQTEHRLTKLEEIETRLEQIENNLYGRKQEN